MRRWKVGRSQNECALGCMHVRANALLDGFLIGLFQRPCHPISHKIFSKDECLHEACTVENVRIRRAFVHTDNSTSITSRCQYPVHKAECPNWDMRSAGQPRRQRRVADLGFCTVDSGFVAAGIKPAATCIPDGSQGACGFLRRTSRA